MKKVLLLFCVSMLTQFCYSQYSGLFNRAISSLAVDAKNVVTDFSYSLSANSRVLLKWNVTDIKLVEFFSVERSANGKDFEMIEVFKLLSDNKFELTDESPLPGRSFYRISTFIKGKLVFSRVLPVYREGEVPIKFYPNPADNLLIIRSDAPLDVQIADATGIVRINQTRIQSLQTINVSSLEKGIYMIRFTNRLTNTVIIERLFKN